MLYFRPHQGWDFSVTIYVRVRGLLDTRFGPQIEISNPDEIEIIGQDQDAQAAHPGTPAPK